MSKYRTENSYTRNKLKIKFSCVLDNSPLLAVQSYIWLNSLLENKIDPENIYIHLVGTIPEEYKKYLFDSGVNIIICRPFDERNKYCNKLAQLSTFKNKEDFDYVFLMDCDTAVVSLEGLELTEKVYAKIVDFPNPPLNTLREIFGQEGFEINEYETTFSLNEENITDWNNCNGGVYIIHRNFFSILATRWKKYALKCIEQKDNFTSDYEKHADQVGFAMAMASLNKRVAHLDIAWNFPLHVPVNSEGEKPKIFHFHNEIDNRFRLRTTGNDYVDNELEKINFRISRFLDSIDKIHVRDIGEEKLILASILTDHPKLLKQNVEVSRKNFGFFTSHFPRVFEYTWILNEFEEKKDISVLDIGAGVCPLPICLADKNFKVTTIDSHPFIRRDENKKEWNEWGFLDYSRYSNNIKSLNIDIQEFNSSELFDVIYSVSVIEHIPKKQRKKIIRKAADLLKKGGKLLLTIDIVPNTKKIWNMSEDKQVEAFKIHGNIKSLKNELRREGFKIISEKLQTHIPYSRTDVYYIKCELNKKGFFKKLFSNV